MTTEKLQKSPTPNVVTIDNKQVLSFDEIPGPPVFRHIARVWNVIPVMSTEMTASAIQYMLSAGKLFGNSVNFLFPFC